MYGLTKDVNGNVIRQRNVALSGQVNVSKFAGLGCFVVVEIVLHVGQTHRRAFDYGFHVCNNYFWN